MNRYSKPNAEVQSRSFYAGLLYPKTDHDYFRFHILPCIEKLRELGGDPLDEDALFLHDVVEDTEITLQDLGARGYPEEVIETVDRLTRKVDDGETTEEYMHRLVESPRATRLKLIDARQNLQATLSLSENLSRKDLADWTSDYVSKILFLVDQDSITEGLAEPEPWLKYIEESRLLAGNILKVLPLMDHQK